MSKVLRMLLMVMLELRASPVLFLLLQDLGQQMLLLV
jgi:hypothetical protein